MPVRPFRASLLVLSLPAVLAAQAVEPPPVPAGLPPPPGPYAAGFDALHYDIQLDLTDALQVRGQASIDLARVPPHHDTLALDLTGLLVTAVRAGAAGAVEAVPYSQRDGKLLVPVGGLARDTLRVVVVYEGRPDDGLLLRGTLRGHGAAFADNWPNRARFWFPSIDHPFDKATVAFAIRAPEDWEVVTGGIRVDRTGRGPEAPAFPPADGVWRSRLDVPVPTYVMVFGATDFAVTTLDACAEGGATALRPDGCVAVSVWAYPQDSAAAARRFARAGDMVAWYSALVGPFPYAHLAHVQAATRFGGMENAGAIFYDERNFAADRDIDGVIAHETAHQWFGDAVTARDWAHLWLSEGFATYFGNLWFEHADGPDALRRLMEESRRTVVASEDAGRPMADTAATPESLFDLLNAVTYDKGAWVLHMLRDLVGDAAFFDGVRRYYAARVNATATSDDLRTAMEAATGLELGWFFDQWVYAPGFPVFRVSHEWNADARAAVITVEQVQPASWPAFRVPVTIQLTTPAGTVRHTAQLSERRTVVRVAAPAPPTSVALDPDVRLLHHVVGR